MITPPPLSNPQYEKLNWFDEQFVLIGWPMLLGLIFLFCPPMWVFSGLDLLFGRDRTARRRATIVFGLCSAYLIFAGVMIFVLRQNPRN